MFPTPGTRLGPYEIVARTGEGGAAQVGLILLGAIDGLRAIW
jgi:hypothetical protein